ncbi:Os08g0497100 [Oryza sativa Japonica Group]|uniref:Os08g0497100 protein n=2 Tax=Oryza TaxID=4527 RepID=A0A0N7KQ30_ORYSJ|nr:Os08g0497100 [Oryza sativa Japonica Group]
MAGVAVAVADSDSDWAAPVVVAAIDDSGRSCVEVTAAAAVEAMAAAAGEAAPVVVADGNDDSGRICGKGGYRSLRWQMRRQGRRRADDRRRE